MRSSRVAVGHSIMAYDESGNGEAAFVLIPGLGRPRSDFCQMLPRLAESARVVAIDNAGFFGSTTERTTWTISAAAGDVVGLIHELSINEVVLVGHSMGGAVALEAAGLLPERLVRHVIAIDSLHYQDAYPKQDEERVESMIGRLHPEIVAASDADDFNPCNSDPSGAGARRLLSINAEPARALLADLLRWDLEAALSKAAVAVTVLASERDLTPSAYVALRDRCEVIAVRPGGHFFLCANPVETAELVAQAARRKSPYVNSTEGPVIAIAKDPC